MRDIKDPLKDKNKQWQKVKKISAPGAPNPRDAFNPMSPTKRPTMHIKTNECDY